MIAEHLDPPLALFIIFGVSVIAILGIITYAISEQDMTYLMFTGFVAIIGVLGIYMTKQYQLDTLQSAAEDTIVEHFDVDRVDIEKEELEQLLPLVVGTPQPSTIHVEAYVEATDTLYSFPVRYDTERDLLIPIATEYSIEDIVKDDSIVKTLLEDSQHAVGEE